MGWRRCSPVSSSATGSAPQAVSWDRTGARNRDVRSWAWTSSAPTTAMSREASQRAWASVGARVRVSTPEQRSRRALRATRRSGGWGAAGGRRGCSGIRYSSIRAVTVRPHARPCPRPARASSCALAWSDSPRRAADIAAARSSTGGAPPARAACPARRRTCRQRPGLSAGPDPRSGWLPRSAGSCRARVRACCRSRRNGAARAASSPTRTSRQGVGGGQLGSGGSQHQPTASSGRRGRL